MTTRRTRSGGSDNGRKGFPATLQQSKKRTGFVSETGRYKGGAGRSSCYSSEPLTLLSGDERLVPMPAELVIP
jgi:hypothetical protein